jgi:hypothetical protein
MKKNWHVERESRQSRSKQFGREENDLQDSLGTRGILVTSVMRENRIDAMRDESGHSARPKSSSRPPQDEYVQRWLSQITQEIDMPSKARFGSRKENGEIALAIPLNQYVSLALVGCDADFAGTQYLVLSAQEAYHEGSTSNSSLK